jgi:drug/metabolite transporter (DMT)-like permease
MVAEDTGGGPHARLWFVEAILGGAVAAFCWAASVMSSSRGAKLIGAWPMLAGVMLVGLAVCIPAVVATDLGPTPSPQQIGLLVAAGVSNIIGLLFAYAALRLGKVAVVAPILSTEGALGAVIAIVAGEALAAGTAILLAIVAAGVMLTAAEAGVEALEGPGQRPVPVRAASLAIVAAVFFGVNLYVTGRIGVELPIAWAILPARLAGVVLVALPVIATRRFAITRDALPFILLAGVLEVIGIAGFALGARGSIAVASVIASQFAAIAALVSVAVFHERLARHQIAGVAIIASGVALLTAIQA